MTFAEVITTALEIGSSLEEHLSSGQGQEMPCRQGRGASKCKEVEEQRSTEHAREREGSGQEHRAGPRAP